MPIMLNSLLRQIGLDPGKMADEVEHRQIKYLNNRLDAGTGH